MKKLTIFHSRFGEIVYCSDSHEWRIESNRIVVTNLKNGAVIYYLMCNIFYCRTETVQEELSLDEESAE